MKFYTNFWLRGSTLNVRGVEDGARFYEQHQVTPSIYIHGEGTQKDIFGKSLMEIPFDDVKSAKEGAKSYGETNSVYGFPRYEYTKIHSLFPNKDEYGIEYDQSLINIAYLDIETEVEDGFPNIIEGNEAITIITVGDKHGKYVSFGTLECNKKFPDAEYRRFDEEREMLLQFIAFFERESIDIITGWNTEFFDIPYMHSRICRVLSKKQFERLSPFGVVDESVVEKFGKTNKTVHIKGIAHLDYMALYRKFRSATSPSWKLDYIAEEELGDKKVSYEGSFKDFYTKDPERFVEYNIHDVRLIYKLEQKLKLISLACSVAYYSGCNYEDVFMNLRVWDTIINNHLTDRNCQVPQAGFNRSTGQYEGAFVKEPLRGFYDWLVSLDLTSLYPSLILQFNISPETFLFKAGDISADDIINETPKFKEAKKNLGKDRCMAANGAVFRTDIEGFIPLLTKNLFKLRKASKKMMLEYETKAQQAETEEEKAFFNDKAAEYGTKQLSQKILLNSLYGILGSQYFRFFAIILAEAITISAQVIIYSAEISLNGYLENILGTRKDRVVAMDTDSAYLNVSEVIKKMGDKVVGKEVDFIFNFTDIKLQKEVNTEYQRISDMLGCKQNMMDMKRESIGSGLFIAPKRYVMKVYDNEGVRYKTPKIKIVGHEAVRSGTPKWVQGKMEETFALVFERDVTKVQEFVKHVESEFKKLDYDMIAGRTSANNINEYDTNDSSYKSGTPNHIKASLAYNRLIDKHSLEKVHKKIGEGEKVKILKLKMPNPLHLTTIAYLDELPEEFGLKKYIDVDLMFHDLFRKPMEEPLNYAETPYEEVISLEDFFS